jgi:acyl carrier protein
MVTGIENLLKESIAQVCGIDVSGLAPDSRLADIGVDSLASAEVLVDLEIRLGRQLPAGTLRSLEHADTIADLTAMLESAFGTEPRDLP